MHVDTENQIEAPDEQRERHEMWAVKLKLDVYEYKNIFANLFRKLTLVKQQQRLTIYAVINKQIRNRCTQADDLAGETIYPGHS